MFLKDNSDNLTIPNFLQALGFIPPKGMTVEEIFVSSDSEPQVAKTLDNYGYEPKQINPNYKTIKYQKKDPKLSYSFSDNYVVPEVAAAQLAEFPKHIQASDKIPDNQPTPQLTMIKSPVKAITILEDNQNKCFMLKIEEDDMILPKGTVVKLTEDFEKDEPNDGTSEETSDNVGAISKAAMYANLLANDLKHIHLHAAGEDFDKIHNITEELYNEALEEADELSEIAIAAGEKVANTSEVKSYVETGDDGEWQVVTEDAITWGMFTDLLKKAGEKYIDALSDIKDEDAIIDDYIHFWKKEIMYKNEARLILDEPMEADYIDAMGEVSDFLGDSEKENNGDELSDDVVDMYVYSDAKANNSSWNGFETMSSDMIVSGGEEVSEDDLPDNFNYDDIEETEDDGDEKDKEVDNE